MAEYIIMAYSPSTGITQRELQLESRPITDLNLANLHANSFATRMAAAGTDGITDWVPKITTIDPDYYARTL
jgi:hypothetical protein